MQLSNLSAMTKGWFVGEFTPVAYKTSHCEAAVKHYPAGFTEQWHYHKIATEITVIVKGEVLMNNVHYKENDIIVINPGEGTDFKTLTPVITTVIKVPAVSNDKYTE